MKCLVSMEMLVQLKGLVLGALFAIVSFISLVSPMVFLFFLLRISSFLVEMLKIKVVFTSLISMITTRNKTDKYMISFFNFH
jgi:hypothetical protein